MINNLLQYYKKHSGYKAQKDAGNISDNSIAFIEDTKTIATHGVEFAGGNVNAVYNGYIEDPDNPLYGNSTVMDDFVKGPDGNYYFLKSDNYFPISHPDISTQPSILPQRFGTYPIYEIMSRIEIDGNTLFLKDVPGNTIALLAFAVSYSWCEPIKVYKKDNGRFYCDIPSSGVPEHVVIQYVVNSDGAINNNDTGGNTPTPNNPYGTNPYGGNTYGQI